MLLFRRLREDGFGRAVWRGPRGVGKRKTESFAGVGGLVPVLGGSVDGYWCLTVTARCVSLCAPVVLVMLLCPFMPGPSRLCRACLFLCSCFRPFPPSRLSQVLLPCVSRALGYQGENSDQPECVDPESRNEAAFEWRAALCHWPHLSFMYPFVPAHLIPVERYLCELFDAHEYSVLPSTVQL